MATPFPTGQAHGLSWRNLLTKTEVSSLDPSTSSGMAAAGHGSDSVAWLRLAPAIHKGLTHSQDVATVAKMAMIWLWLKKENGTKMEPW